MFHWLAIVTTPTEVFLSIFSTGRLSPSICP
jgi:hypothetical protein